MDRLGQNVPLTTRPCCRLVTKTESSTPPTLPLAWNQWPRGDQHHGPRTCRHCTHTGQPSPVARSAVTPAVAAGRRRGATTAARQRGGACHRAAARRCLPSRRPPRDRALPAAIAAASRCLPVRRVSIARRHCSKQLAHTPYGLKPPGRHFDSALRVAISMDHAPRQRTRRVFISLFLNPQRHRNSSSLDLRGFRDSSDRLWCTSGRLLHRQSVQKVRAMKYPKELDITPEVGFNHSNISQYFHMLAPC